MTGRKRVSPSNLLLVQNLIERCLQLYMTPKEAEETLRDQAQIEPALTKVVWQKLEEENQEFFKVYYVMLKMKQQIVEFNRLLVEQARLMALPQNALLYVAERAGTALMPGNNGGFNLNNVYRRIGSQIHLSLHADGNFLVAHPTIGDAPDSSITSVGSNSPPLKEEQPEADTSEVLSGSWE